ncbi:energy transducer TonB [Hellea sp.]|nr:energy transducer TonB [Hellea sp.]
MRIFILFVFCTMIANGTAHAKKRSIDIATNPEGVQARVYRIDKNLDVKYLAKCKTPCTTTFRVKQKGAYKYYVTFEKKGYVSERDLQIDLNIETLNIDQTLIPAEIARAQRIAKNEADRKASKERQLAKVAAEIENCRKLSREDTRFNRDMEPCRRLPATMPPKFMMQDYSGYCNVKFDILPTGNTANIIPTCTDSSLERPTLKSVQEWIYIPARKNGQISSSVGVEAKVQFIMTDEKGYRLPFPDTP